MNVRKLISSIPLFNSRRSSEEGQVKAGDLPKDTVTIRPFENPTEALGHRPGALKNPVILVNGLARDAHDWNKLVPWLTSNPQNSFGGVYQKGREQSFQEALRSHPEAKVFALDPSNNLASPRVLAGEVRLMIDHIIRETGAERVDLVAHSQGGLDALAAIDQGEDRIGKVVSLATPWKGAAIAGLARRFENILAPVGKDQGALLDLRPLDHNPWLRGARQRLSATEDAPDFHSLSGSGTPTPGGNLGAKVVAGDGFVGIDSGLGLEGAKNYHLSSGDWQTTDDHFRAFSSMDVNHLGIVGNSSAFKMLGEILTSSEQLGGTVEPESNKGQSAQPDAVSFPAEEALNAGEDAIHDRLREAPERPIDSWLPKLDEVQSVRQQIVESEIGLTDAHLSQELGARTATLGVAATAAGLALAGPLLALPGVLLAGFGVAKLLTGRVNAVRQKRTQQDNTVKAQELRLEIERQLEAGTAPHMQIGSEPFPVFQIFLGSRE